MVKIHKNNYWILGVFALLLIALIAYYVGKQSSNLNSSTTSILSASSTGNMSASEIFARKADCAGYLQKLIDNEESDQIELELVYRVSYSETQNSCLEEEYIIYPARGTTKEEEVLKINDILSGNNLWTSQLYSPALKYWDADSILDTQMNSI